MLLLSSKLNKTIEKHITKDKNTSKKPVCDRVDSKIVRIKKLLNQSGIIAEKIRGWFLRNVSNELCK